MSDEGVKVEEPVMSRPKSVDPKWQEKVKAARDAREMGKRMRAGKPGSFRGAVGRHA